MRPYPILKISDRDGNLLEESRPDPQDAIRADTAFVMTNLLRGVVQRGTAGVGEQAGLAAGRQDGHDRRLRRCVVHRLRSRHHRRRLGRPRRAQADRPQRNRRRGGAADLDRVHARLHRDARSEEPAGIRRARATSSSCRSTRAAASVAERRRDGHQRSVHLRHAARAPRFLTESCNRLGRRVLLRRRDLRKLHLASRRLCDHRRIAILRPLPPAVPACPTLSASDTP